MLEHKGWSAASRQLGSALPCDVACCPACSCGGNGECVGGFCMCKAGFWGMDCTRSKAYEPDPDKPIESSSLSYNL